MTDPDLDQLFGGPSPAPAEPEQETGRFHVTECNRDGFLELAERHKSGEIRMTGMEAGTCSGINRLWLWRVSWNTPERAEDRPLVQASLL